MNTWHAAGCATMINVIYWLRINLLSVGHSFHLDSLTRVLNSTHATHLGNVPKSS